MRNAECGVRIAESEKIDREIGGRGNGRVSKLNKLNEPDRLNKPKQPK